MKTEPHPQTGDSDTKGLTQTSLLNCSKPGKRTFHSRFCHSKAYCRIDCAETELFQLDVNPNTASS